MSHRLRVFLPVVIAGLVAGCSSSSPAPDAPSVAGSLGDVAGAAVKSRPDAAEAHGAIAGLSGGCPDLTFTLDGTTVRTDSRTTFAGGTCGDAKNGAMAGAVGAKQPDGSIQAKVVKLSPDRPGPKPTDAVVGGPIADLGGGCPSISFTLGKHHVATNGQTTFEGKACGDLHNGDPVRVAGTVQSDRTLLAKRVIAGKR